LKTVCANKKQKNAMDSKQLRLNKNGVSPVIQQRNINVFEAVNMRPQAHNPIHINILTLTIVGM